MCIRDRGEGESHDRRAVGRGAALELLHEEAAAVAAQPVDELRPGAVSYTHLDVYKRQGFKFWPWFAALGLYGWVLFNAANVDARIADYNVDAYLGGRLPQICLLYTSQACRPA